MSTLFIVFKPEYTYLYAFNCIFVEYFYDFVHRIEYLMNMCKPGGGDRFRRPGEKTIDCGKRKFRLPDQNTFLEEVE